MPTRTLARLGLSFGALAAALGVAEAGVRLVAPQPLGAEHPPPLLRGEFTAPGEHPVTTAEYHTTVHVNAHGFVDREWGPKSGPRVVLLGDSFVQAAQVGLDEGFGRQLQAATGLDVVSLGVPGAGTATELELFETYAVPLEPDVVVLCFFVSNDVLNNHPALDDHHDKPFYRLSLGGLVRTDPVEAAAPLPWLWHSSALFRLLARTEAERRESAANVRAGEGGVPLNYLVYGPGGDPRWTEAWAVTDALVSELAAECAERGVRFGVVLFPDRVQATQAGRAEVAARYPAMASWNPENAEARALALVSEHGPALDLMPVLQAADRQGEALYFPVDGHWTAAGHRVAAQGAAAFVEALARGE